MLGYVFNMKLKYIFTLIIISSLIYFLIQVYILEANQSPPILLWWTPFNFDEPPRTINCWNEFTCVITGHKNKYRNHTNVAAFLFYGTNFKHNDLPLPRNAKIPWAIFHEESPKNNAIFLNKYTQNLFNITSTFSRFSTLPLTLQYLKELGLITNLNYFVPVVQKNKLLDKLAPILYIQSDCDTPIQRDLIVGELMKYIKIDSYGVCLNNKQLPQKFKLNGTYELYGEKFMAFVAQYKFTLAIENAKCNDYITEKLWRPLIVGSVPIYLGASTIRDWLPNNDSAILIDDFASIKSLVDYIKSVNEDDGLYLKYLKHKTNHISNVLLKDTFIKGFYGLENNEIDDVIPAFECFVCKKVHNKQMLIKSDESIYACPKPIDYKGFDNTWKQHWELGFKESKALSKFIASYN